MAAPRRRRRVESAVLDHPDAERAAEKCGVIVELCDAALEDRETIARLLNHYLRELASYRESAVSAADAAEYPYLDAYFSEPGRHPFLIRRQESVVGCALIRGPASTGRAWEVAEFYIVPESRRAGAGGTAVAAIWRRFPGDWELQVHRRNSGAVRFWLSRIKKCANQDPEVEEVEGADGRRLRLRFSVDPPLGGSK